ncbi:carboxypeptidase regulatory-like domain-containing protein [Asticcacaulis solisilvae]|uniref:carboxypeptidase regulatory-like domain-containing protein n=1 Tax=Asticcacaulis solisilvae TaxID=1217274 RepID=UPI003FD6C3F3
MFNKYMMGAAAFALLAASAPAVYAQQTTAALRGVVTDSAGKPVAGATVTVIHTPTGTREVTRTDKDGNYQLTGLKVGGPYEIDVASGGYSDSKTGDVYLTLGDQQKLDVALETSTQTVIVKGKRTTLANPGSRTRLGREAIDNVVTYKRDIREAARRDPLTQLDAATRGTGPSGGLYIAGSAPRANRITIDGVKSSDDFGLNTGGLSTNLGPISLEAVEQMTVQAVPADVEEGDFTGGALNLVLRSGTNSFHGSAFTYLRDKAWNGNQLYHPDTHTANRVSLYVPDKNYGFFFSGPILKDRLFFATSYEKYTSASIVGTGPAGGGFGTSLATIGNAAVSQSDLDTLLQPWSTYAASSKLAPGAIPLTTEFKDEKYSIKIDWNIMDGQRLSATYRHAYSFLWKGSPSLNTANYNTAWYTQPENEDNYAIQLNSRWTDQFSTEARIAWRNYQRGQTPPEGQGFAAINYCTDPAGVGVATATACTSGRLSINFGPDQFRQANVLKTTNNSASFVGIYRLGDHSIKGGYQGKQIHVYNLFVQAANGVYYFDNQADFANGKVNQLSYNNDPGGDLSKTPANFDYINHTLFLQDTFDPFANTTLNYGLRYDFWTQHDKPALNPSFTARNGYSNQGNYDGLNVVEPRLGLKWHSDDNTLDASGSFGLYTGGLPDVFISNRFGNTGILTAGFTVQRQVDGSGNTTGFKEINSGSTYLANDATILSLMNLNKSDAGFITTVPAAAASYLFNPTVIRVASTNTLSADFKMPSDWKLNFAGHWRLPTGTTLGLDGVFVRSNVGLAFRDVRARKLTVNGVQQYTPDGRIRYDGLVVNATVPSTATLDAQNQSIFTARTTAGLDVAKNADGSNMYDLANPGSGYDVQAYNPDVQSTSSTVALSVQQSFDNVRLLTSHDHLDLSAALTHQATDQYGGLPEFATTDCCAGSSYGDQFSLEDPNAPTKGKSSYEVRTGFKVNAYYKTELVKGFETRINLFGDMHEGRPVNFYMADLYSSSATVRGQVFGVVSNNQLAFIPQTDTPIAGSGGLGFMTGNVPVYFATTTDLANFQKIVSKFGLQPGIVGKGQARNPDVKRWDLHLAQDVPLPWFDGHKVVFTMDIFNLGNLLNKKWGVVAEYGAAGNDGRQGAQMYKVGCTNASGTVVAKSDPTCVGYQFSSVSTTATTLSVNQAATLYAVMFGLKYSF